jgi:hypothetical protein
VRHLRVATSAAMSRSDLAQTRPHRMPQPKQFGLSKAGRALNSAAAGNPSSASALLGCCFVSEPPVHNCRFFSRVSPKHPVQCPGAGECD